MLMQVRLLSLHRHRFLIWVKFSNQPMATENFEFNFHWIQQVVESLVLVLSQTTKIHHHVQDALHRHLSQTSHDVSCCLSPSSSLSENDTSDL